jgi:hypothetical protein
MRSSPPSALPILSLPVTLFVQGSKADAAEATAIAYDNPRAVPVYISGATGKHASRINGFFDPSQKKGPDGRLILTKRGDASILIEHFGGMWQIKPASCQGDDLCFARVPGGCALAKCSSFPWRESNGEGFIDAPGVKMETGAEAERKVSGCCLRAHQHALLPPVGASNRFL